MEYKINEQVKGTRIMTMGTSRKRRDLLNKFINYVESEGFEEIILPSIEPSSIYVDKAGPEATATIQGPKMIPHYSIMKKYVTKEINNE